MWCLTVGFVTSNADPYPGSAHAEADLLYAARSGDNAKLTAVGAMAVLGELGRLRNRLDVTTDLLRASASGGSCWAARQGYTACEVPGVGEFLAGQPARKRWWKRS